MKKSIFILLTLALVFSTVLAVYAKTITCRVVSVEKSKMVIDCGDKAHKFKTGDKVTLKPSLKRNEPYGGGC